MSLITKILKPEEFNAAAISKGAQIPGEFAAYVLYQLGARGIIGTVPAVLQPERFNAQTIAVLLCEHAAGPNGWNHQTETAKMALIDQVQAFLDQWERDGVIG
jgi:hypothetical protein